MIYIYPTDTAYAIGCDARDENAVRQVFRIKGREHSKTLPLIAANTDMARQWCDLHGKAEELAKKHWPGPLTLVLPVRGIGLSPRVIKDGFVAIRVPDSKHARELSEQLGGPIVSTSANASGDKNCYSIDEARASLGDKINLVDEIIDAGALDPKEPSTIIKIEDGNVAVLRKGSITL